jgi:hypothetical protein
LLIDVRDGSSINNQQSPVSMTDLDFESSQLQLLTDALRAGPGTPLWREALATLENESGADEYKLLYAARERLASGRRYREVRAGQGFTRKVFDAIDDEQSARTGAWPSANLIAAASALVILTVLAIVVWLIMPPAEKTSSDLSQTYFVNTLSSSRFDGELGMEWAAFGSLGVEAKQGLRPILKDLGDNFRGGGVFYERSVAANQPFALEASVRVNKPSDDLAVQLFVTDDANFTGDSATSEHELVWLARSGEASVVLPGGHLQGQGTKLPIGQAPLEVRLTVNQQDAIVEMNGQKMWSGKNGLDGNKPRMVGLRFLARGAGKDRGGVVVESVRLLTPQK